MALTELKCKNTKAEGKPIKLSDSGGLFLQVMPNGKKYWRLKYRYLGKEKLLSLGVYPLVTLAEARDGRDEAKKLLSKGIDPSFAKKDSKRKAKLNAANTFEAIAREWHERQKNRWGEGHAQNVMRRLEVDVFPHIGNRPIADIDAPELLQDVLRKIEKRGALDVAGRIRTISGQIFRYAIQTGRCKHNPTDDLSGALMTRKTKHFAALDIKEIPELLNALKTNHARLFDRTRRAINLSLLTFVRPGELRQARWEEIDFDEKQWTIPAERMKMRRPHIVPLSRQAIEILKEQQEEVAGLKTEWVFPSQSGHKQPMSDGTVLVALKRMGFHGRMTAHGFRALARTTIREKLDYSPDVIEQQLAHKAAGALGEAYDRSKFLTKRKKMMQDWANYLDAVSTTGKVIVGNFKREKS